MSRKVAYYIPSIVTVVAFGYPATIEEFAPNARSLKEGRFNKITNLSVELSIIGISMHCLSLASVLKVME